ADPCGTAGRRDRRQRRAGAARGLDREPGRTRRTAAGPVPAERRKHRALSGLGEGGSDMSAATTHTHMIDADALREAVGDFMIGFGSEPREIELVTNNLVEANLTGHDSHGIGMLPRYAN